MKLFFSLTKARNVHEGITKMAIEISKRTPNSIDLYGDALLYRHDDIKKMNDYYKVTFPNVSVQTKKVFVPSRLLFPMLDSCKKNIFFHDKKEKDDIKVYFYNFIPNIKCKAKKVLIIHDLTPVYDISKSKRRRKTFLKQYIYSANKANLIFTDSEYSKKEIIKYCNVPDSKIIVNYCGVDKEYYKKEFSKDELERIREKYNLPNKYIFFVGQPRRNKNLLNLIEGYSLLDEDTKKEFGLVLANSTEELENKVKELGLNNVKLLHGIDGDDIVACYKMSSLVSLISTSEGFGLPLVEAMCCGIPTITSNVSCLPEVAGGASILVDPYNVKSISNGLKEALTNDKLREELIQKGFERIKDFDWDKTAKTFYDGIERVKNGNTK